MRVRTFRAEGLVNMLSPGFETHHWVLVRGFTFSCHNNELLLFTIGP